MFACLVLGSLALAVLLLVRRRNQKHVDSLSAGMSDFQATVSDLRRQIQQKEAELEALKRDYAENSQFDRRQIDYIQQQTNQCQEKLFELRRREDILKEAESAHQKRVSEEIEKARKIIYFAESLQQKAEEESRAIQSLLEETSQSFPWLAKLYADHYDISHGILTRRIMNDHPRANRIIDELRPLRAEKQKLAFQLKQSEYQLHFYESLFPWLEEFKELPPMDAFSAISAAEESKEDEYASLQSWLSPAEYRNLCESEKYQLALDRFRKRPKSNWEIGIEYERYIGYLCEQRGYSVSYSGATLGLEDMGRDLILTRSREIIVIQCKRWAQEKSIHEKHIFQLFGSCTLLAIQNRLSTVKGVFVTTAALSPTAKQCAEYLDIAVYEHVPPADYPVIKCNISACGEKIYHLPFDQQYDRVVIDPQKGEFYAMTVQEAVNAGFRHAFKWHGSGS